MGNEIHFAPSLALVMFCFVVLLMGAGALFISIGMWIERAVIARRARKAGAA